jgi:hypothetical protein
LLATPVNDPKLEQEELTYMIWGEARVKLKLSPTFAPGRQAHFVSTG